jgi:23S rRNA pseudouridine1911/1915/1917 synthase
VRYEFRVPGPDTHKRLDLFLIEQGVPYSRSQLQKWIEEGRVTVNGQRSKGGYRLKEGDLIEFISGEPVSLTLTPENIPLSILYEDGDLLVLDKPAGLVVHPAAGNYSGTLVHALLFHCQDLSGIGGVLRPGIVHRLDKDTSGLMVVAKNDSSHQQLVLQFQRGKVVKEYQALVWGLPPSHQGRIESPIGRHPIQRKKMAVNAVHGKSAITEWQVIKRFSQGISWLQLGLKTGRTHQIRVHLSNLGWPVVGDSLYGGHKYGPPHSGKALAGRLREVSRQLLHSHSLAFLHPTTGIPLNFSSDLPKDMADLIEALSAPTNKANSPIMENIKNP